MWNETKKSFLQLCEVSSSIFVLTLDFHSQDTVVCLDVDIDVEEIETSYWGRENNHGYEYKTYRF